MTSSEREHLRIPDRFEALADEDQATLRGVITPVDTSLAVVDERFDEIFAAGRGGLMILKGVSGAGKSTFAKTIGLFRSQVSVVSLDSQKDLGESLAALPPSNRLFPFQSALIRS